MRFVKGYASRGLTHVQFNSDGDLLFASGKPGNKSADTEKQVTHSVTVWNPHTGQRIGSYDEATHANWSVDVTHDSKYLATSDGGKGVMIFDVETGQAIAAHNIPKHYVRYCTWNRKPGQQNKLAVAVHSYSNTSHIEVLEFKNGEFVTLLEIPILGAKVNSVQWGAYDATLVATHDLSGLVSVWDAKLGTPIKEFDAHKETVQNLAFTDDRSLFLTCSTDKTAKLWEVLDYTPIRTYETDRALNCCGISPLWNAKKYPKRQILLAGGQSAEKVTHTEGSGKFEPILVEMVTRKQIGEFNSGTFSPVNALAFNPGGTGFATGAEEGIVRSFVFDDEYFDEDA